MPRIPRVKVSKLAKNVVVDVKPGPKIVLKKKYRKPMNMKKIANAVARINCEKKESVSYVAALSHGQIYTDGTSTVGSGHYLTNGVFLGPNNGTTDTTRVGDEISITGIYSQFQFAQQANTTQKIKGKIYFFSPRLGSSLASVAVGNFLNPNSFLYGASGNVNNIYDTMSSRNMDYIKDFKVLRVKNFTVSPDLASTTQKMGTTVKCGIKFKNPWKIRWNSAGSIVNGQIWMLVVFDSGNSGSTAVGAGGNTTGIFKTDVQSGVDWSYYAKTYYIDP